MITSAEKIREDQKAYADKLYLEELQEIELRIQKHMVKDNKESFEVGRHLSERVMQHIYSKGYFVQKFDTHERYQGTYKYTVISLVPIALENENA